MTRYTAFMRAVNVAGHATVRMSDVRDAFAAAGCRNASTYIQSGNVVFESPSRDAEAILQGIRGTLRHLLDEEPVVLLRTVSEIEDLVRQAPFKALEGDPSVKRYVVFLSRRPRRAPRFPLVSSQEALEAIAMNDREVFVVSRRKKNGFFGFPNRFIETELGIPATSRNWSTVTRIVEFARREGGPKRASRVGASGTSRDTAGSTR